MGRYGQPNPVMCDLSMVEHDSDATIIPERRKIMLETNVIVTFEKKK